MRLLIEGVEIKRTYRIKVRPAGGRYEVSWFELDPSERYVVSKHSMPMMRTAHGTYEWRAR